MVTDDAQWPVVSAAVTAAAAARCNWGQPSTPHQHAAFRRRPLHARAPMITPHCLQSIASYRSLGGQTTLRYHLSTDKQHNVISYHFIIPGVTFLQQNWLILYTGEISRVLLQQRNLIK